jgi:YD repeat-containing protein
LDNIKEGDIANQYSKYQFKYENLDLDYTDFISDYWGYYKLGVYENDCVNYTNRNRDTDKVFCKKDVLKQIIYPTKGSAIFEFEPNTYSYIGDTPIPDDDNQVDYSENFLDNPDNTSTINLTPIILSNNPNDSTGSITYDLGTFTENKTYVFNTSFSGADETNLGFLYLKKTNPSNSSETIVPRGLYTGGCPLELKLEAGYHYDIKFDWGISAPHSLVAIINIDEKTQNSEINKWLYGGGIRIKNIYYTDNDPAELNTQSFPNNYSRKISYNYNFFNDSSKSSGSLVFQKPVMHYQMKRVFNQLGGGPVCHIYDTNESNGEINYEVYSSSNNLSYISTKGSDVGYKNVTVRENGRTEFEYLTPIDYSEEMNSRNVVYPFAPTANFDYRRGLLLKTKKYDENSRVLKETENHYEFEDYSLTTGFTTFYSNLDCPYAGMFTNYDNYRAGVLDPNTYPTGQFLSNGLQIIAGNILNWNARNCGEYVSDFVSYYPMKEAFGWAKLMDTLSKDYFYDSSGNQSQLINSILYTYNPGNMQLATQKSTTSTGLIVENKYYYTINSELDSEPEIITLRNNNMVDTPLKIETFKAGNKISEQKTIYNNWGNTVLLPQFIQTSKGNNSLETRVSFNQYDEYGHPLELQQQNGTKICYIWGYNKTQLVAKLENINYSSIPSNLITSVQTASDTGTEASLISALTALRNHNLLTNAMITTYTYIPLVGVSTITDPKGNKTTYMYDTLGRLVQVKDRDNNILTENEYHYKN